MPTEIKSARDALEKIIDKLEPIVTYMKPSAEDGLSTVYAACKPIYDIARAALSLPRKNCEVGTAREQAERMAGFCHAQYAKREKIESHICSACPLLDSADCVLEWGQMPDKEGGAE